MGEGAGTGGGGAQREKPVSSMAACTAAARHTWPNDSPSYVTAVTAQVPLSAASWMAKAEEVEVGGAVRGELTKSAEDVTVADESRAAREWAVVSATPAAPDPLWAAGGSSLAAQAHVPRPLGAPWWRRHCAKARLRRV